MPIKPWKDVVDMDFPHVVEVTPRMVQAAQQQVISYPYSGLRLHLGRISPTKDLEERRAMSMGPLSQPYS